MKKKLKIGICLGSSHVPSWQYGVLMDICNSDFADIVIIIKNEGGKKKEMSFKPTVFNLLTNLLESLDKLIFRGDSSFNKSENISGLPVHGAHISYSPELIHTDDGRNKLNEAILTADPDLVIDFGSGISFDSYNTIPRYGIWKYSIVEQTTGDYQKTGFWEVLNNSIVTNSSLTITRNRLKGEKVIFNLWESTCPYSINRNRNILSWRTRLFVPRILNAVYVHGEDHLDTLERKYEDSGVAEEIVHESLALSRSVKKVFNYFTIAARYILKNLFYTYDFRWSVLFKIREPGQNFLNDFGSYRELKPPRNVYWADPFVISEYGDYFVFVEEFIYQSHKAHISVLKLNSNGDLISAQRIIERPYHMSYPFTFRIQDTYYMIPETSQNRTIELYKCKHFPDKWEFCMNLMVDLAAVDTTLFYHNEKWWMFTSIDQTNNISGCSTELFLFFTDDIFSGSWTSHPCNPVVSDSRSARPAGKIYAVNGRIFRPSQDCTIRYGRGFKISEIIKLTENEFEETLVSQVEPAWDNKLKGTHTYNFDDGLTVIDVYSFRHRLG